MSKKVFIPIITRLDTRILNLIKGYMASSFAITDLLASYHYSNHAEILLCTTNNVGVHCPFVVGEYSELKEISEDPETTISDAVERMKENFDTAYSKAMTDWVEPLNPFYQAMSEMVKGNKQAFPDSDWIEYKFVEPLCTNNVQVIQFLTKRSVSCANPHAIQVTIVYDDDRDDNHPLHIYVHAALEVTSPAYRSFNPLNIETMQALSGDTYSPNEDFQFEFGSQFYIEFECPPLRENRKSVANIIPPIYIDAETDRQLDEQFGHIVHPAVYVRQVKVIRRTPDGHNEQELYMPTKPDPECVFMLEGSALDEVWAQMIEMSLFSHRKELKQLGVN